MNHSSTPVQLHSAVWNPAGTQRILLVHGLGSSSGVWWRVASELADQGMTVVAVDLRGHGRSPAAARYRFDDLSADLVAVGGSWDLAIGHSLAGPILARFARHGSVRSLLLLDPVFDIDDDLFDSVVADQLAEHDPSITPDVWLRDNPRWHAHDAFQKAADVRSTSRHVIERCLRDNHPFHHLADLGAVGVPTIVLGADPAIGTMCPAALIDGSANEFVSHRVVPGVGHGIPRERPDAVVEVASELVSMPEPQSTTSNSTPPSTAPLA